MEGAVYMDTNQFMEYLCGRFYVSGDAHRLMVNILNFVNAMKISKEEKQNILMSLLGNAIGLTEDEIKQIII